MKKNLLALLSLLTILPLQGFLTADDLWFFFIEERRKSIVQPRSIIGNTKKAVTKITGKNYSLSDGCIHCFKDVQDLYRCDNCSQRVFCKQCELSLSALNELYCFDCAQFCKDRNATSDHKEEQYLLTHVTNPSTECYSENMLYLLNESHIEIFNENYNQICPACKSSIILKKSDK